MEYGEPSFGKPKLGILSSRELKKWLVHVRNPQVGEHKSWKAQDKRKSNVEEVQVRGALDMDNPN